MQRYVTILRGDGAAIAFARCASHIPRRASFCPPQATCPLHTATALPAGPLPTACVPACPRPTGSIAIEPADSAGGFSGEGTWYMWNDFALSQVTQWLGSHPPSFLL